MTQHGFRRYVAIGDSFSEGYGDLREDGTLRGWADFVALGLARASAETVSYANLAIRGRKLLPILDEQLDRAIAMGPDLVSFNGGGNDIMRPRVSIDGVADRLDGAVERLRAGGAHVLLLSGANPSAHIPMGSLLARRGEQLAQAVRVRCPREGVTFVDNWADRTLADLRYWSVDRLHLNALGHARVASNVLTALDVPVPEEWGIDDVAAAPPGPRQRRTAAYYREHVLPWIGRRLTGRSSGDGREPKIAQLQPVDTRG
ncbi:SGNH/GDSL hydrolase family protein [Plantibacter sp. CFBP 8798]|uniref:SGNH/GDSL hydrolase family protein n=1 Tax=Plantibacter sp. CFBP 8798 TaxID=2775268 RepID=UPI00177C29D6|nr:SGNH/GDSL hydrolase family protein [Plantibacter sp. CFBP 8798]MBD8466388.1 SGNH/GDSL hydrolase family protein [Plantibacter sp. CFBP 8798]